MCIFASSVADVAGTSILVARAGTSQLTVYQMTVELERGRPNAMILPVPGQVESLVDLSAVPTLFSDLSELFAESSRGLKFLSNDAVAAGTLKVHDVGDYKVSIVPSVKDLTRLDLNIFELSPRTRSICKVYYKTGFSFVVAVLRRGGTIHPLGYTHPLLPGGLFVPTRHEHGEAGPPGSLPVWDHEIYFQGPARAPSRPIRSGPETYRQATAGPTLLELRRAAPVLKPYLRFEEPVSRLSYYGRYENRDLHLKV